MGHAKFSEDDFLGAAMALVAERGPSAVTVASVSERVGSPTGSFYHRFASRDVLLGSLWLRAVLEFFPWTEVPDLVSALRIVEAAERAELGILVDTLHFNRSTSRLDQLDQIPPARLPFVHVSDALVQESYTTEELLPGARRAAAARRGRH